MSVTVTGFCQLDFDQIKETSGKTLHCLCWKKLFFSIAEDAKNWFGTLHSWDVGPELASDEESLHGHNTTERKSFAIPVHDLNVRWYKGLDIRSTALTTKTLLTNFELSPFWLILADHCSTKRLCFLSSLRARLYTICGSLSTIRLLQVIK